VGPERIAEAWTGLEACRTCGIRHLALFADLREEDFAHVHAPVREMRYAAGEALYAQEEPADAVFTVRRGLVKIVHLQPDGTQRIVRLVRPGGVAGIEALAAPAYAHGAAALGGAEACRIPAAVVHGLQERTPRLHRRLMEKWHEALSTADGFLVDLATGSARRRLARLLLLLSDGAPDAPVLLPTREDMGAIMGTTLETASRTFADLRRSGAVSTAGQGRATCDREALRAVAEGA